MLATHSGAADVGLLLPRQQPRPAVVRCEAAADAAAAAAAGFVLVGQPTTPKILPHVGSICFLSTGPTQGVETAAVINDDRFKKPHRTH